MNENGFSETDFKVQGNVDTAPQIHAGLHRALVLQGLSGFARSPGFASASTLQIIIIFTENDYYRPSPTSLQSLHIHDVVGKAWVS